jgi:hypothetical protein
MHRYLPAAALDRVEGVLYPLLEGDVPCNNGDRLDPHLRVVKRHHQSNRVIRGGIGIDQKTSHFSSSLSISSIGSSLLGISALSTVRSPDPADYTAWRLPGSKEEIASSRLSWEKDPIGSDSFTILDRSFMIWTRRRTLRE